MKDITDETEMLLNLRLEETEKAIAPKNVKYCGVPICNSSVGHTCGSVTHGWHDPDSDGYFDMPCFICARYYEKLSHSKSPHWPFPKPTPVSQEDQFRALKLKTCDAITRILMDEGNMWIDELHAAVTKEIPDAPFDMLICNFVKDGKIQFIFPGPLVAIAIRTSPKKGK